MFAVAPSAGAWIEIYPAIIVASDYFASLPPRERGLKYKVRIDKHMMELGRSLRGSVD